MLLCHLSIIIKVSEQLPCNPLADPTIVVYYPSITANWLATDKGGSTLSQVQLLHAKPKVEYLFDYLKKHLLLITSFTSYVPCWHTSYRSDRVSGFRYKTIVQKRLQRN